MGDEELQLFQGPKHRPWEAQIVLRNWQGTDNAETLTSWVRPNVVQRISHWEVNISIVTLKFSECVDLCNLFIDLSDYSIFERRSSLSAIQNWPNWSALKNSITSLIICTRLTRTLTRFWATLWSRFRARNGETCEQRWVPRSPEVK